MHYEKLLIQADREGLLVRELPLESCDGMIAGNRIAIRRDISTTAQKSCVLAEELGHYYTTSGDILDQTLVQNRKQERIARIWSYFAMAHPDRLVQAYTAGCQNRYEIAEYLNITEEFLQEALDTYKEIYGTGCHQCQDYLISFDPLIVFIIEK